MRNIMKQIEKGNDILDNNPHIDMIYPEMRQFIEIFRDNECRHGQGSALFCAISDAYAMGISVGYRKGFKDGSK